MRRDNIFENEGGAADFLFDTRVAEVFDDMLNRSIPFYSEIQRIVVEVGGRIADGKSGIIYDIGCSTGTTLLAFLDALPENSRLRLIGIEPSEAMRDRALSKINARDRPIRTEIWRTTIEAVNSLPDAQAIIMLFTLQFVRPINRPAVVRTLYASLCPGGCLLLGEKTLADNSALSRDFISYYHDYKRRSGYSELEIARKREALENVLIPYRNSENITLLKDAGFSVVEEAFRWYSFVLYLALKT